MDPTIDRRAPNQLSVTDEFTCERLDAGRTRSATATDAQEWLAKRAVATGHRSRDYLAELRSFKGRSDVELMMHVHRPS